MSDISDELRSEFLADKEYAHGYMESYIDAYIATQIKVLREQREWSQEELANETDMKQARISVLENIDYASWSVSTLRRFARAYDLVLKVSFEEFGAEIERMSEFGAEGLERRSRTNDLGRNAEPQRIQPVGETQGQAQAFVGTAKELLRYSDGTANQITVTQLPSTFHQRSHPDAA